MTKIFEMCEICNVECKDMKKHLKSVMHMRLVRTMRQCCASHVPTSNTVITDAYNEMRRQLYDDKYRTQSTIFNI